MMNKNESAVAARLNDGVKHLHKTQAALLDALRSGVKLHYVPCIGIYFRGDNLQGVTAAARALLSKGLAEKHDQTLEQHRVRAKAIGEE
jgi:hypothetical protein